MVAVMGQILRRESKGEVSEGSSFGWRGYAEMRKMNLQVEEEKRKKNNDSKGKPGKL